MMSVAGQTVEELVHYWSEVDAGTEAFISISPDTYHRRSLTRFELNVLVRRFAAVLRQAGLGKGDVVCVALPNSLERVVVDLGTICSGAIALNGQVFRKDGEDFLQALSSSKAKAVVLDPSSAHSAWGILKEHITALDEDITCQRLPHLHRVITCQCSQDPALDFLTSLHNFTKSLQRAHALPSDVAVMWTTSGSTGYSKLVPQTHSNLVHIVRQVLHIAQLASGDKFLNCAPLGWAGGFPLWFLASGATRVFVDMAGPPPASMATLQWECVQREKCVYMFTSPMYISQIMEKKELWQGDDWWQPQGICLAGQPMKRAIVSATRKLCQHVDINYGTTECGVIATLRVSDPQSYQDGATGLAALGVKVRVVDDQLRAVPQGQAGEILAHSPALYGQYVDNEHASHRAFTQDGWFRSDDVGYFLQDGSLIHLGRRSDTITRGTYLCYPGWLETLLRSAPGVRDVCVVPVPDPVLHQEICACIISTEDSPPSLLEDSLRTFANSQLLTKPGEAQHMVPKYYVLLQSFPLTATGKINRRDLCAIAENHLALSTESE